MNVVDLPASWMGRAVIVTEVGDLERWFSAGELAAVRAFARAKRRQEWMLSRIAEKIVRQHGARGSYVSFSHSGRYGAAAVADYPVGVDVEQLRDISEHAARLFLTGEETEVMQQCTIPHRMLHFWSAKEALWKERGGAVPTLKRVPLRLLDSLPRGLYFEGVETYAGRDFVSALTLPIS